MSVSSVLSTPRMRAALLGAAIFLACTPTEPCACPPATTVFLLFGNVIRADAQPAPQARLAAQASHSASCSWDAAEELIMSNFADEGGAFRTLLRSPSAPAQRCVRLVAYAGEPGSSDSTVIDGLILSFRHERPDSLGLVLRLP